MTTLHWQEHTFHHNTDNLGPKLAQHWKSWTIYDNPDNLGSKVHFWTTTLTTLTQSWPAMAHICQMSAGPHFLIKPWQHWQGRICQRWPNVGPTLATGPFSQQPFSALAQNCQRYTFYSKSDSSAKCFPFFWPNTNIWPFLILCCIHFIFMPCPRVLLLMLPSSHWCSTWLQIPRVPSSSHRE